MIEKYGHILNEYVSDYVLFDLETTGLSADYDEVVEISALKVRNGKVIDDFTMLVNPGRPIPYWATEVNGITDAMVENSPDFKTALKDFLNFAGEDILVGHNIHHFDMKFIERDAMKYWGISIENDYIDTLPLARQFLPHLGSYKLTELAKYYGISDAGAHRALNDCRMNQKVFEKIGLEMKMASHNEIKVCPKCGKRMVIRNGKFGKFWGCSGYPACHYTMNIESK